MKILNSLLFFGSIVSIAYLISCSEDIVQPVDQTQLTEDSLNQSVADNLLIDTYIQSLNLHADSIRIDASTGTRYAILENGNGVEPELNDILSFHHIRKFVQNPDSIYETSYREVAKKSDSLNYVALGIDFDTIIKHTRSGIGYEGILDSLNRLETSIGLPLFLTTNSYAPLTINYVENGSGLANFPPGIRIGLTNLLNLKDASQSRILSKGSKVILFLPSAAAYGTFGDEPIPNLTDKVPPNTPIIFELNLVNIRN